jgi:hypothetical protein
MSQSEMRPFSLVSLAFQRVVTFATGKSSIPRSGLSADRRAARCATVDSWGLPGTEGTVGDRSLDQVPTIAVRYLTAFAALLRAWGHWGQPNLDFFGRLHFFAQATPAGGCRDPGVTRPDHGVVTLRTLAAQGFAGKSDPGVTKSDRGWSLFNTLSGKALRARVTLE